MADTTAALNNLQTAGSSAPLISEILTKVNNAKDKPKKVAVLRENDSQPLRQILKGAFDPKIKWALPSGDVPFIANDAPEGTEHTDLAYEARKLWHFIEGGDGALHQNKRESMFVQMLEGLHPDEAEILIAIKDQKLSYKGLTYKLVKDTWPDLLPEQEEKSTISVTEEEEPKPEVENA